MGQSRGRSINPSDDRTMAQSAGAPILSLTVLFCAW